MPQEEELLHILALMKVPGIGDITAKQLIANFGSASEVFRAIANPLAPKHSLKREWIDRLRSPQAFTKAAAELNFVKKHGITCLYFLEDGYPERLSHCVDAPVVLFCKGEIDFHRQRSISIVGTRKMTAYGKRFLEMFMEGICSYNPLIVSGFAYGVDITAQRLAMQYKLQNIGCLAHGLHKIYPDAHKIYAQEVMDNGGFITDFWSDDDITPGNFISRNRIIAGLSEATIVVESAEKGGALSTAGMAFSYDREVFALPGDVFNPYSVGCNRLIQKEKARIITSAEDLVSALNWGQAVISRKVIQKQIFMPKDDLERKISEYLIQKGKSALDEMSRETNIPVYQVAALLLEMELQGFVRPLPGKMFEWL